ncbi:Dihydroorotase [Nakaseomyces bracarensis]|uniref:Dihydroorotase n=1 Tax=Nakaseomyces bracarensis TaxID=273131 RepID=A0ABR4NSU4_9SACH
MSEFDLGITCDMHVHVRDGAMSELITPTVKVGGVSVCYVMPNLQPPIVTLDRVVEYKKNLEQLAPETTFLMSFYLSRELTPELVHKAAQEGAIHGTKCYPAGVTTNSAAGVDPNDFSAFYPIFKAMEEENLVLNLHGEKPSVDKEDIHVLNAEESFLPALKKLHNDFPNLKIVLEHCTTEAAVRAVEEINQGVTKSSDVRVAATLTAHHLFLTIDDWAGNPVNFCKPVAKLPRDRRALVEAATSGKPYFFFGSDSAPHPIEMKARHVGVCAGVYTQSLAIPYVAQVFAENNKLDKLKGFVSDFGLAFYGITPEQCKSKQHAILYKNSTVIPETISKGDIKVAVFKHGQTLDYSVKWQ